MAIELTPTKTTVELKAMTAVAAGVQSKSTEQDCSTAISCMVHIDHGLDSATTPTGTQYLIQISHEDTGDNAWHDHPSSVITGTTAPTAIATIAEETAGATVIECGASLPALNDVVFFKNSTLANSEFVNVVDRVTTGGSESFTLRDGLKNTQAAGTYYNKAELFSRFVNLESVKRIRVVCNNNYVAGGASCVWRCTITLCQKVTVNVG